MSHSYSHNNFSLDENDEGKLIPNKKNINGFIKIYPKNKRNSNTCENIRTKSLNINRRECKNYNRNYTTNSMRNSRLLSHEYIDEILRIDKYIQHPYSINNNYDKKKWINAHNLRNRMKEYDIMTRKKLYENNIINKKAKFDRERYVILNRIPIFREAFPIEKDPSDKNKEAIIRTYLKTHASYLLSESKKNKKNFRKKKKFNNSSNFYVEKNNPFNYINYKQNNNKFSENYKNGDSSYNLQKKKNNEKIKNRSKTPFTNRNLNDCEIVINGIYNKVSNVDERRNFPKTSSRQLSDNHSTNNKIHLNIKNFPKGLFNDNEKRESCEWNSNITKINMCNSNNIRNSNIYDYSNECKNKNTNDNSERNTYYEINSRDNFSNQSNYTDECLTKLSDNSKDFYTKNNIKNDNIFKKDRYSLLGKIKNNKDVKVKLVLNKV
ncbi:conserved Plasmodium protein, unknown function [Plasmodium gallinaceum]|uniref:Uncharacterized protein n=1 Tax=Plasmodium gallinaceum TaxID=5849 RepID=A0A1J1GP24_PLAGA|nr:conserved Plasmodium protein, unknown function [Plasmodium gallinaceum]CRG94218.1 conserved Plasmodium protein, unknown function [Plasmodium gallinaceum]